MTPSDEALSAWPRASAVSIDDDRLRVRLRDGRTIDVPLASLDWLASATDRDRRDVRIVESGAGLWWDAIDEGLSVPGLLGLPEDPPRTRQDRYVVRYRAEGGRWVAEIPELESWAWGRTLTAARREARALLAMLLDAESLEAAGVEVAEEVVAGHTVGA
jgi:predicted RNase H-like HicB family nuclease